MGQCKGVEILLVVHATETGISSGVMGSLARKQTFTSEYRRIECRGVNCDSGVVVSILLRYTPMIGH